MLYALLGKISSHNAHTGVISVMSIFSFGGVEPEGLAGCKKKEIGRSE